MWFTEDQLFHLKLISFKIETIMRNRKEKQSTLGVFTDIALQKGLLLLIAVILLLVAIPISAQETSEDDWEFGLQVYLWCQNSIR